MAHEVHLFTSNESAHRWASWVTGVGVALGLLWSIIGLHFSETPVGLNPCSEVHPQPSRQQLLRAVAWARYPFIADDPWRTYPRGFLLSYNRFANRAEQIAGCTFIDDWRGNPPATYQELLDRVKSQYGPVSSPQGARASEGQREVRVAWPSSASVVSCG
jgi:hypothetical protein